MQFYNICTQIIISKVTVMICEIGFKIYYKDCIHLELVYLGCFKKVYN